MTAAKKFFIQDPILPIVVIEDSGNLSCNMTLWPHLPGRIYSYNFFAARRTPLSPVEMLSRGMQVWQLLAGPYADKDTSSFTLNFSALIGGAPGVTLIRTGPYFSFEIASKKEKFNLQSDSPLVIESLLAFYNLISAYCPKPMARRWQEMAEDTCLPASTVSDDVVECPQAEFDRHVAWYADRCGQSSAEFVRLALWIRARELAHELGRAGYEDVKPYRGIGDIPAETVTVSDEELSNLVNELSARIGQTAAEFTENAIMMRQMDARSKFVFGRFRTQDEAPA